MILTMSIIFWIVLVILSILAQVFMCLWVYRDAKNHCVDPALWVVLTIFFGWIGLILYFAIGRKQSKLKCPQCFQGVTPDMQYCEHCGAPISSENIIGYSLYGATYKKRSTTPMIVLTIVAFVLSIALTIVATCMFTNAAISGKLENEIKGYADKFSEYSQYYDGNTNGTDNGAIDHETKNEWEVTLDKNTVTEASRVITITAGSPNEMYVDYDIDEGTIVLVLTEGDKIASYNISGSGDDEVVDLGDFVDGDVAVSLSTPDAVNGEVKISW